MKLLFAALLSITFCQIGHAQLPGRSYIWDLTDQPLFVRYNLTDLYHYKDRIKIIDSLSVNYRRTGAKLIVLWCFNDSFSKCTFIVNGPGTTSKCYHFQHPSGMEVPEVNFPAEYILRNLLKDSLFFCNNFSLPSPISSFTTTWVLYNSDYPNSHFRFVSLDDLAESKRPFAILLKLFSLSR